MKLTDVMFRDAVRSPTGSLDRHYRSRDYEISWEGGVVTIANDKGKRCVPASNVIDMTPAEAAKK